MALQLIPYVAGELATPAAEVAGTRALAGALSELRALVRAHAVSSTVQNVAGAIKSIYDVISPHVTRERVSAVRSAIGSVVRSYWKNDHAPSASHAQQLAHARALSNVVSSIDPKLRPDLTVLHRQMTRVASGVNTAAIDFHALSKIIKSTNKRKNRLVGVETNPGPNRKSMIQRTGVAAAYGTRVQTLNPRITMSKNGRSTRIRHRELLDASVLGYPTFNVRRTFDLNPGVDATFPWLAPQAVQWEQYIAHSVVLIWIPIAPTSAPGTIAISPSYDPSDPEPITEQQLSNAVDTVECSVWKEFRVPLNRTSMMTPGPRKFVRGALTAGDIKTFDVGVVYIATNNCVDSSPVGKLWIEYDFEFFVPQNSPNVGLTPSKVTYYQRTTSQTFATTVPEFIDFGTDGSDPLLVSYSPGTGTFVPRKGFYRVSIGVRAGSNAASTSFQAGTSVSFDGAAAILGEVMFLGNTSASGGTISFNRTFFLSFDGEESVSFLMTLTGTGTLTSPQAWISFEIV